LALAHQLIMEFSELLNTLSRLRSHSIVVTRRFSSVSSRKT
jgi:hypothetical protein